MYCFFECTIPYLAEQSSPSYEHAKTPLAYVIRFTRQGRGLSR